MINNEDSDNLTKLDKNDENISAFSDSEYTRGEHPNSLKNLKPFPKGVSGNPMGKPHRYQRLAECLNVVGDKEVINYLNEPVGYTYREGVLKKIWEMILI